MDEYLEAMTEDMDAAIEGLQGQLGRIRTGRATPALLDGVNDSLDDARRLPRLLQGLPAKVNLIPMNSHPGSAYGAPSEERIDAFLRVLAGAGMRVTLRRSRGPDIDAACGQLALRGDAKSAA